MWVPYRTDTPIEALIKALQQAPSNTNPNTSLKREMVGSKSTKRWRRNAPVIAARVEPTAWPKAADGETGLNSATRNVPTANPGQTRYPQSSTAASAIPDAGHTGPRLLLLMLVVAWPSLPARK